MQTALLFSLLAGLSTALGGVLAALFPPSDRLLAASAGFAGGVMVTVSLADLLPEAADFYRGYLPPLGVGAAVTLLALSGMVTAALLAGLPYEPGTHSDAYLAQLFQALGALGAGVVTVTGVRPQPDVIGNVACDCRTGEMHASMRPAHPGVFYGTGDVFASAFAARLVRGAPLSAALETATALTDESICRSLWRDTPRRFGVDCEGALPAYIRRVEKIFEA